MKKSKEGLEKAKTRKGVDALIGIAFIISLIIVFLFIAYFTGGLIGKNGRVF